MRESESANLPSSNDNVRDWHTEAAEFPESILKSLDTETPLFKPFSLKVVEAQVHVFPVFLSDGNSYELFYAATPHIDAEAARAYQLYTALSYPESDAPIPITFSVLTLVVLEMTQLMSFSGRTPDLFHVPMLMGKDNAWYAVSVDVYLNPEYPRSYLMPRIRIVPLYATTAHGPFERIGDLESYAQDMLSSDSRSE